MPNIQKQKAATRHRRHARVRARVVGSAARPRLSVFRSQQWMNVQLIDDAAGKTLVSLFERQEKLTGKPTERARALGLALATKAIEKGLKRVVFDRGGYVYHGRVAAFADGAREGGLEF